MNNLSTQTEQTMSSLEIAKLTEKRHQDVLRDIRKVLEEVGIEGAHFCAPMVMESGQVATVFNLPRRECDLIIAGYSAKYRLAIIDRWHELEAKQKPKTRLELAKEQVFLIEEIERKEAEIAKLNTVIDNEFEYCSILRAARFLGVSEKVFNWRVLKRESEIMLGIPVKRVPSPRYGYQNLYHIQAFINCHPEYDFYGLVPENIDNVQTLALTMLPYGY